eukprot:5956308-Alexandrium_andersonii.AAC.1
MRLLAALQADVNDLREGPLREAVRSVQGHAASAAFPIEYRDHMAQFSQGQEGARDASRYATNSP